MEEQGMANDVFMNVDALPEGNIEVVAERLELRAEIESFARMRDQYFDAMALPPDARILELGGGTGPVGRAYVRRGAFSGCYVVSDLSQSLIDIGAAKAETEGLAGHMEFRVVDALTGEGQRRYTAQPSRMRQCRTGARTSRSIEPHARRSRVRGHCSVRLLANAACLDELRKGQSHRRLR